MATEKYLIINADDFGMCRAHNAATIDLFKCGGITSATIMAPCPAAREAVEFAVKNPELSVGVHLTTTAEWKSYRWGPISENVPSLCDGDGCFFRTSAEFASRARIDEVERELTAQIEHLLALGLSPSHIDNHMGTLYGVASGNFELLKLVIQIAARYSLPFRFPAKISHGMLSNGTLDIKIPESVVRDSINSFVDTASELGVAMPDYLLPGDWLGEQDKSYESYREYIFELYRGFDFGITETYIHPAIECDEIKSITPLWHRRVWEHRLFSDPKTADFIDSLGIKLIDYRALNEYRKRLSQ